MRTGIRRALLAGATLAVGAFVWALLGGGDDDDAMPLTTTTTEWRSTLTTIDLVPSTTAAPASTVPGPAPPPEEAPAIGPDGAVLSAASGTRTGSASAGCAGLARDGYDAECGSVVAGGTELAWLVETSRETGGLRVSVLRAAGAGTWEVVLAAVDDGPDGPSRFRAVTVVSADVSGDGAGDLVVGFRDQGTSGLLEVDVVEPPGRVTLHRSWEVGEALAERGRLHGWAASYGAGDARCCPSAWVHETIGYADGAWRLLAVDEEQRSAPPEGQFE